MTDQQKEEIIKLRRSNYGYKSISNKLGLPVNTIKSYCKRHSITKGIHSIDGCFMERFCLQCGSPIIQDPKRKEKKYCSDACRNKWWNAHGNFAKSKTGRSVICAKCGKEFYVNMQSKRKYCSHTCYINDRFYGTETDKEKTPGRSPLTRPEAIETKKRKPKTPVGETLVNTDDGSAGTPFLSEKEGLALLDRIRKIKCKCRKCGKEFEFYTGYSMRYCCSQCFMDDHPGAYLGEMNRVKYDGPELTPEELQDLLSYAITKSHVQKMVQQSIIGLKEYFEFMILMLEKYRPDYSSLFLEIEISESTKGKSLEQVFERRR